MRASVGLGPWVARWIHRLELSPCDKYTRLVRKVTASILLSERPSPLSNPIVRESNFKHLHSAKLAVFFLRDVTPR